MKPFAATLAALAVLAGPALGARTPARVWEEALVIPTYLVGPPDPDPIFFAGRAYQGAKGPVYPYPFLDRLTDRKVDKTYRAVYLENEYLKICVLPELGGRIFSAFDKIDRYDFVYRQHVVKPALIGMLGAWISGGVEWNIPHHHRATTFMEVDQAIETGPDGSATAWVGEIELRQRMKWLVGLTLRPGRAALEVTIKVINRTALAESMLAWANVAISANADYQVVFPPDVEFATFHGKNQFSRWPVSTEVYNRQDYTKGVDVSLWASHGGPTSFFAWDARGDFLAGYDHGKDAGVAFVADSHFVPGKKLWTWGTGSEGRLWERLLTDADGPYAELMVGAFSDNQPDYSWIQPGETRTVTQTWFPLRGLGGVTAAAEDGACNLAVDGGRTARIGFLPTRALDNARVSLRSRGREVFREIFSASPEHPFRRDAVLPPDAAKEGLSLVFTAADSREILSYAFPRASGRPLPQIVTPPPVPKDIPTVEELYLAGLRLDQLYNPAVEPSPYYEEALRRDPGDYRSNTALGLLDLKRCLFTEAESRFRAAVARANGSYVRPKDGEALYYLGIALRALGRPNEAEDALFQAAWSAAWRSAALRQCAELASLRGDGLRALDLARRSLETNALDARTLGLIASLSRRSGDGEGARTAAEKALAVDPLDGRALYELTLLKAGGGPRADAEPALARWRAAMRGAEPNALELAADYGAAGLWDEAVGVLDLFVSPPPGAAPARPATLARYFLAYCLDKKGSAARSADELARAAALPSDLVFPFQSECLDVFAWASRNDPKDAHAPYFLGNFLFDLQPEAALAAWKTAVALDGGLAVALRNLGLALARVKNDLPGALALYDRALAAAPGDPRLYAEADQLREAARVDLEKRLSILEKNAAVVALRDDALARYVQLLVRTGRYDRAIEALAGHHFHVWEGGGGVYGLFVDAHLLRGLKLLDDGRARAALQDFDAAATYPPNLEVAAPAAGGGSAKAFFLAGTAREALGDKAGGRASYEKAAALGAPGTEQAYYAALALRKIGREPEANRIFDGLVRAAADRLKATPAMDFFEKFGEKQSALAQGAQAHFLLGLGCRGQGRIAEAKAEFSKALELDYGLTGAVRMLEEISK